MSFHSDCYNKDFMLTNVNIFHHLMSCPCSCPVSCPMKNPLKSRFLTPSGHEDRKDTKMSYLYIFIYIVIRNIKIIIILKMFQYKNFRVLSCPCVLSQCDRFQEGGFLSTYICCTSHSLKTKLLLKLL